MSWGGPAETRVFVNVHRTVSPTATSMCPIGLPSSQVALLSNHIAGMLLSLSPYPAPGTTSAKVCVSPFFRAKLAGDRPPAAANPKTVVVSLAGSVSFFTMIVPRPVLVNVQVTVPPAPTLMSVTALPLSQVAVVRLQPAGMEDSLTLYAAPEGRLGARPAKTCVCVFLRVKLAGANPPDAVKPNAVALSLAGSVAFLITMRAPWALV